MRRLRNAKIVATIGPASSTPEMLARLFAAGADVFRLNFSHGSHDDHRARFDAVRALERSTGRPVGIMMDLQGPKLRVGTFAAGHVVETNSANTRADGMATRQPDAAALAIIRQGAARVVTVSDDEVAGAIRAYWTDTHNLAEGAGAAPLAALLQEKEQQCGRRIGVVLCGGNIDLALFKSWVLA